MPGLGNMRCNTVMTGYKYNWRTCAPHLLVDYVGIINDAFDADFGVMILRLPDKNGVIPEMEVQRKYTIYIPVNIFSHRRTLNSRRQMRTKLLTSATNSVQERKTTRFHANRRKV
jgi:hypothetical protein